MNEQTTISNASQIPNNAYPINDYFQPKEKVTTKDSFLRKQMKSQFSFFAPVTILYALFYTFCLYKNASGITYPFFVVGTFCYFFLSMKKLKVPYKKDSLFYIISIFLLGLSNCCTDSIQLLRLNKLGIFILASILVLHTVYQDTGWSFLKYTGAFVRTGWDAFVSLFTPFSDLTSFCAAKKEEKTTKESQLVFILLGIAISIPILFIMITLLSSADIVFHNVIHNLFSFDLAFTTLIRIGLMITCTFFASYALLSALSKKNIKEEVTEKKILEPIVAITVTGMLCTVYLLFSVIQILYLFIGKMKLPAGYTYSVYAREGFFQLLTVCIINLVIVLFCISFFKDNIILKILLTIISGCTYIMILSSAIRMFMYISVYNLTFLRVFVLWALMVIFLLMIGITIYIYNSRFPLFFYSIAITTVFYIVLSFVHPDYLIARYNLYRAQAESTGDFDNLRYLSYLSADAAPVLLDTDKNPYIPVELDTMKKFVLLENKYGYESKDYSQEKYKQLQKEIKAVLNDENDFMNPIYYYYKTIYKSSSAMNFRNFNFSIFIAECKAGL